MQVLHRYNSLPAPVYAVNPSIIEIPPFFHHKSALRPLGEPRNNLSDRGACAAMLHGVAEVGVGVGVCICVCWRDRREGEAGRESAEQGGLYGDWHLYGRLQGYLTMIDVTNKVDWMTPGLGLNRLPTVNLYADRLSGYRKVGATDVEVLRRISKFAFHLAHLRPIIKERDNSNPDPMKHTPLGILVLVLVPVLTACGAAHVAERRRSFGIT